MSEKPIVIAAHTLRRIFGSGAGVQSADLVLREGEITCLLGPSGCGKSTLLRMIAGLETPEAGQITVDGAEVFGSAGAVPPERRGVGLVFQDYALFPHLSVLQNVVFGLKGLPRRQQRERAMAMLEQVRLADRAGAYPHMLSGGEQQRVALARVLVRRPRAVLLDEPFSGLDAHLKGEVREALLGALRAAGAAVLVVTHDADEALRMADHLVLMDEGHIIQDGTPHACYARPASVRAARLLGDINVLDTTVRGGVASTPFGDLPAPGHADGPTSLLVRPEAMRLAETGVSAPVRAVSFAGAFHDVTVEVAGQPARLRLEGPPPPVGSTLTVAVDAERAVLL